MIGLPDGQYADGWQLHVAEDGDRSLRLLHMLAEAIDLLDASEPEHADRLRRALTSGELCFSGDEDAPDESSSRCMLFAGHHGDCYWIDRGSRLRYRPLRRYPEELHG